MHEVILEFNEMLHSGNYEMRECYEWLKEQVRLGRIKDYETMYPEIMFWNDFKKLKGIK